ncbi:ABC transporter permease [Pelosinus sp. sgz500959]|uniref:ABC transporter permease n=1 Tax=Pelosinus sp. sgz500959 TaxID=3242472 RepID=UPI00366B81C1
MSTKLQTAPGEDQAHKRKVREIVQQLGALLGLVGLCVILTFSSEYFLTMDNIMNIARQSAINSLVALGMLLTILTAGIDLSVGSILALSIVLMGIVVVKLGMSPIVGIIVCLGVGAFVGLVNGLLLTKMSLPHPFISTMGTQSVARGLALIVTAASPISNFPAEIQLLGGGFIGPVPISFILVVLVYALFHIVLNYTTVGRHIYAVGGNPEATRLSGINIHNVLLFVYTISGLMAALAGLVLVGRVNSAYPLAGLAYESDAIAAVIIGGASFMGGEGTVWGTLIGAMIMAVVRNGLNLLSVSSEMQTVAIGIVIILAVYVDVLRHKAAKKLKA